ncbi:hypothetical protein [Bacillus sp. SJS]|uniref:hypothetical protein n=1 Tax=Bacillus sp. SJS TaxID=1423321 RepID=UPI0004DD7F5C|nr:hypothetical protein [Bacillus sp. SJS]KZZ85649.1 hypothetical protein AS29_003410 [Bacillus sp. SJS]
MAEINIQGYQSIRDFIQSNWKYIELRDNSGVAIIRLSPTDSRVTWQHTAGSQTLKLQVIVKGSDSGMTLPKTFASSAIYSVASGGNAYSVESFSPFTMETAQDELTVIHSIQVPKV